MTIYHKDKTLPNRFKECRINSGLSQKTLSIQLGLKTSGSAIRMYEQRKRIPSIITLIKMSKIFKVSTDYLLCIDDSKSHSDYVKEFLGLDDELIKMLHQSSKNKINAKLINDYISNYLKEGKSNL